MKALVIDNDTGIRQLFVRILQPIGFKVKTLSDTNETLKHLKEDSFNLLITEVKMLGKGREHFANEIQSLLAKPPLIIICSGVTKDSVSNHLLTDNIEFLQKPFKLTELYHLIDSYFPNYCNN